LDLEFAYLAEHGIEVEVAPLCGYARVRRVDAVPGRAGRGKNFPYGKRACDRVSTDCATD